MKEIVSKLHFVEEDQLLFNRLDRISDTAVKSVVDQQEEFLRAFMERHELSLEHFIEYYILDQYPMEFEHRVDPFSDEVRYRVNQTIVIRLKTPEERGIPSDDRQ